MESLDTTVSINSWIDMVRLFWQSKLLSDNALVCDVKIVVDIVQIADKTIITARYAQSEYSLQLPIHSFNAFDT